MLYLFNSAARPTYVENVLNTLHLPNGAINVYQYETFDNDYIDPSIDKNMEKINGEDVIIVFIDRNDDSPNENRYIPLRRGVLRVCEKGQGKSYFHVELKNYIVSSDDLEEKIKTSFSEKLFYVKDGKEYGYLAFRDKEIKLPQKSNKNSPWLETVKRVMGCAKLKNNNCVYTRFNICNKKGKIVDPSSKNKEWCYTLNPKQTYRIVMDYYVPFADESPNADTVTLSFWDNSKKYVESENNSLGVQNGKWESKLIIPESQNEFINLNCSLKLTNGDVSITHFKKNVPIKFKKKSWILQLLPFVIFALSAFVSTLIASFKDYAVTPTEEAADSVARIISNFDTITIAIILGVCAVLEALSLFWMKENASKK